MSSAASRRRTAKREQIAGAARKLFLDQGFAGTSMDAVTAEAGVSKQTLYKYFPTKIDLLGAVLTDELTAMEGLPPGQPRLDSVEDLRAVLLQFASRFFDDILKPDSVALLRLIIGEVFRIPELRDSFRIALPGRLLDIITGLVRLADARGIIHSSDPELTARMLVGPLMTFVALGGFLSAQDEVSLPEQADLEFIVDAFLATVRVQP